MGKGRLKTILFIPREGGKGKEKRGAKDIFVLATCSRPNSRGNKEVDVSRQIWGKLRASCFLHHIEPGKAESLQEEVVSYVTGREQVDEPEIPRLVAHAWMEGAVPPDAGVCPRKLQKTLRWPVDFLRPGIERCQAFQNWWADGGFWLWTPSQYQTPPGITTH